MNVIGHLRMLTAAALLALAAAGARAQDSQEAFTLKVNSDLVLTNVVVRDKKTGEVVRGLKASDFQVLENGKPQSIISFDFQSVDQAAPLNEATINGKTPNTIMGNMNRNVTSEQLRNHRLIVMFFDIPSMQPEDLERAQDAARNYINGKMQPADLVAVVSLDQSLSLDRDFTAIKQSPPAPPTRWRTRLRLRPTSRSTTTSTPIANCLPSPTLLTRWLTSMKR